MDLVALKYAVRVNGVTGLALNHLDTIGKLGTTKLCVGYKLNGKVYDESSDDIIGHENEVEPVYEEFTTSFDIKGERKYDNLPDQAKKYVERIEKHLGIPVKFIGTGPDNEDMIIR